MPHRFITQTTPTGDALWTVVSGSITGFTISSADLTGPVAALFILIAIGIALWRGAGALFREWLKQAALDRAEREKHHAETLKAHDANSTRLVALIESQQECQLETVKATLANSHAIEALTAELKTRACFIGGPTQKIPVEVIPRP